MKLPESWEKRALILVAAIFIISVIYALNPFLGTPTNNTGNQTPTQTLNPIPFPILSSNKNVTNQTNNTNNSFKITPEQAQNIATQAMPGFTAGTPLKGSVYVNNTNYNVWIVPLTKSDSNSKTIYIEGNTGVIVLVI
ncbi:MAG: peptidase [Methanobacterium sp.]|nr:peptidase [Methanobacterium sp.]